MNPPTFSDGPPVPLMTEGTIDAATLTQLVSDLLTSAEVLDVREKSAPVEYAGAAARTLRSAVERLVSGATRAVQVRYSYDGHEWTDTILATTVGFRVVRCRHDG